jgi:ornithine cyclodeaminase/alanine dehydrogenase-like protein (mu-crystallin family)
LSAPRIYSADEVHAALGYGRLIDALREAFRRDGEAMPVRQNYEVGAAGAPAYLLTMPAWRRGKALGVKLVTVFPENAKRGRGAVSSLYVLMDGETGVPLAIVDGDALTVRRTAAASALASSYLSRPDSRTLVVVGTGHLAPHLAAAHCAVRPISRVLVWGRNPSRAHTLSIELATHGIAAEPVETLRTAMLEADIVSCATTSTVPLIMGRDLTPGTHVDLVGAFRSHMRESDDEAVIRSSVFVDTYDGAFAEAGDLLQPIAAGRWSREMVRAELKELVTGTKAGRQSADEITLFKSVGAAIEDLAAAELLAATGDAVSRQAAS